MTKRGVEMEWEMKKGGEEHQKKEHHENRMYYSGGYPMMYDDRNYMYADEGRHRRSDGTFYMDGGQNHNAGHVNSGNGSSSQNYYSEPMERDEREGRSYMSRKMYMEAKEMKKDRAIQLRELEKYMQELSQDITEMIADASPEERQYLEKKVSALATKIGSMK
jgi:hypothetical protein